MKIISIETMILKFPLNRPMRTRYITLIQAYCVLVFIKTDNGFSGQGMVRAGSLVDATFIQNCVNHIFSPQLQEKEFIPPQQLWQSLWLSKRNHLQSSFALYALAAIDIALWDIQAKLENKPLYKLLNIKNDWVSLYGNGGWLADTPQETQADIGWYLKNGCNHFKMRIGCDNDIERIKAVRNFFGNELILSVDANQYFDFNSAVEMSKRLADFNVMWFEEPLFSNSLTELTRLAELSPVPIATGENMNTHWQIKDVCELHAAHVLQPDVIFQGGITEFQRSAEIINNANLTMGAHLFHELSCSIAGLADKHYVEHIDFFPDDFFIHDFSIKDGKIRLPKTPGHGADVSTIAIEKYYEQT